MTTLSAPPWQQPVHLFKQLPLLGMVLAALLSSTFWLWQWHDAARYENATQWYLTSGLYALEAENYFSHLTQTKQQKKATSLEKLHQEKQLATVALAIVSDREFAYFMETTSSDFWGGSVYPTWRALRTQLNDKTRHFSRFKWGLSGADKRPLTFFTHGFLSLNAWQWGASVAFLLVVAALVERRIGELSFLILFTGGTAITGLFGLLESWNSAAPSVGALGGISVLMGVLLFQDARRRWNFCFTLNRNGQPKTFVIPFFGSYWVAPWLAYLCVDLFLWQISPINAVVGLMIGLFCGWDFRKRMQTRPIMVTPSRPADDAFREAYDKALTKLSGFDFRGAENALHALFAQYPERGEVAERLFMLRHYRPHDNEHEAWSAALLERISHDANNLQNVENILQELNRTSGGFPLPSTLLERLLINATQAERYAFAIDLARLGIKQQLKSALFLKGLRSLAHRLRAQDESVALQFEQIARNLSQG